MAGRPKWNLRLRHEWLAQPMRKTRVKRRTRLRVGLEAALERKREKDGPPSDGEKS